MSARPEPAAGPAARPSPSYFDDAVEAADPEVARWIASEAARQRDVIEMIASENIVSRAVLDAQGSLLSNKTVEGYPGRRYHGGAECVDRIEEIAIDRACRLFGADYANVQPHSGSQANQAVFKALLKPGDPVLSMDLKAGGHLSHGARANISGAVYDVVAYGVRADNGLIDYDALDEQARIRRPKLIVAGGSSYPRALDLARLRAAGDAAGARLLVDMAHFAGLVAGGVLDNPVAIADVVTSTTYKSLRGARGGLILSRDRELGRRFDAAVFPGVQGSVLLHAVAGKAVGLGEALRPEFADYARAVQENARAFADRLASKGIPVVTGGTDTPLVLVDLSPLDLAGDVASDALDRAHLTCNKNLVPGDRRSPQETSGLRFGMSAVTTRGFGVEATVTVAGWVAEILKAMSGGTVAGGDPFADIRSQAIALARAHPIYRS